MDVEQAARPEMTMWFIIKHQTQLETQLVKAKFRYTSSFGAGSKLVRSQIPLRNVIPTSFEPAPNQLA